MSKLVHVTWQRHRSFVATTDEGHVAAMDGGPDGMAMSPSTLLLAALGGCVSTTVIGVLEKKRQQISHFQVDVTGEQMPDWPKAYTHIHLTYKVRGTNIDPAAVARAIELAETRYCTVSASLNVPISHRVEITEETHGEPTAQPA